MRCIAWPSSSGQQDGGKSRICGPAKRERCDWKQMVTAWPSAKSLLSDEPTSAAWATSAVVCRGEAEGEGREALERGRKQ